MYSANQNRGRYASPLRYELDLSRKFRGIGAGANLEEQNPMIEDLNTRIKEYESLYIRQRAEMENYARAKEKEISRIILNASHDVIRNMLPVMDSIDSAIKSSSNGDDFNAIRKTLMKVLEKYGLKEIQTTNQKFDPFLHEAVAVVNDKEDGIIKEEYQKGYKLNDEVLRTSKVVVGKKGE